jgi:hypothetical protein
MQSKEDVNVPLNNSCVCKLECTYVFYIFKTHVICPIYKTTIYKILRYISINLSIVNSNKKSLSSMAHYISSI